MIQYGNLYANEFDSPFDLRNDPMKSVSQTTTTEQSVRTDGSDWSRRLWVNRYMDFNDS